MDRHDATEFSELMARAGLGMAEAAALLDVSPRTVRRHLRGETRRINRLRLDRLRTAADACFGTVGKKNWWRMPGASTVAVAWRCVPDVYLKVGGLYT